jgi:hypothetical protein
MTAQPDTLTQFESTPSAASLHAITFERLLATRHTVTVGVVQAYDAARQTVTVQPAIRKRFANGETARFPTLVEVPVAHYQAGGFVIHAAPAAGDPCLLLFSERSIDEWLIAGCDDVTAQDPRRFDLQDAVALLGLSPYNDAIPAAARPASAITIATRDGATRVEVRSSGVVTITAGEVRLGGDAATPLAVASPTQTGLNQLYAAVAAIYTWGATVTPPLVPLAPFPAPATPPTVAATKTKGV